MKASRKSRRKIHQMRAGWRSRGRQGKRETMTSLWKRTTSLALFSKKPLKRNQRWWLTGTIQSKPMTLCQKKCQGIEFPPGTCQCSHHLLCEHQGETDGSGEGCHHPAHTCWTRVGPGGKADWCSWLGAHAIFDDSNEIIQECHGNGIMAFAICTNSTQHSNTPGAAGGNLAWLWKRPLGPLGAEGLWKRLPKRFAMKHEKKCPGNRHQTVLQRT